MKTLIFFALLILIGTPLSLADTLKSTLSFTDKTQITGQVSAINQEQNILTFSAPSLQEDTELKTAQLLEMSLSGKPEDIESDHYAIATIKEHFDDHHRDTLRGRLVGLDEKTVTLDTWYAGQLTLKRSLVHTLDIFSKSPTFYAGPNGPKGWVTSRGKVKDNWTFKNRSMISKSQRGIARQVQIPERAKITLTAHWKNSPYFRILFLSEDGTVDYPNSGYSLTVSGNRINLERNSENQRNADLLSERVEGMSEIEKTSITIYLDRSKEGTSAIYFDNKRIGTWKNTDDTLLTGDWLHFVPNRNGALKVSNISINQWDGRLPVSNDDDADKRDLENSAPELEGQEIRLANGDIVIGTIKTIDQDLVHLSTSFGDVSVPLRLMKNIMLSEVMDQDRMYPKDVRAWFHEGGYVTIRLTSFDGETIKGHSQVYGEAQFKARAFSRIEFNIWEDEINAARLSGDSNDW